MNEETYFEYEYLLFNSNYPDSIVINTKDISKALEVIQKTKKKNIESIVNIKRKNVVNVITIK